MAQDQIKAVGHRIRQLRMAAGLTMEELANRIGGDTHFTTIGKIEKSQRTISLDWIMKIAGALNVEPSALLQPETRQPVSLIPLVGAISAGNWREAVLDPIEMIPVSGVGPNVFALRPEGDSMNMLVGDGAIVVVDPDQLDLMDGKLYAVMNGDSETTFKRYRGAPPRLEPVSSNPEHVPIPLGREPFTVIGRVVWQMEQL